MTFEYSCVAHGTRILCQCALTSGNFDITATDILARLDPKQTKDIKEKNQTRYFILQEQNNLNLLVAGTKSTSSDDAFKFLTDISRTFLMQYARSFETAPVFGMQQEFQGTLKGLMESSEGSRISQINENITETSDSMQDTISNLLFRESCVSEMSDKTNQMVDDAHEFSRSAAEIRLKMFFEKYKIWILIGGFTLALIILIIIFSSINETEDSKKKAE